MKTTAEAAAMPLVVTKLGVGAMHLAAIRMEAAATLSVVGSRLMVLATRSDVRTMERAMRLVVRRLIPSRAQEGYIAAAVLSTFSAVASAYTVNIDTAKVSCPDGTTCLAESGRICGGSRIATVSCFDNKRILLIFADGRPDMFCKRVGTDRFKMECDEDYNCHPVR